jgi:hypothetical protein
VFVDQYGADQEDVIRNRIGETRSLRKLLAPKTARSDAPRQLVEVRHLTLDDLTQDVLADARLVVVAGLHDPAASTALLREYVQQGGQLVIAAGGTFDPEAWNDAGWNGGAGILPLPLLKQPIGEVPEAAGSELKIFHLSFESLLGEDFFQLANVPESELRDLYSEPFFFKAVEVDATAETLSAWRDAEIKRLEKEDALLRAANEQREEIAAREAEGQLSDTDRSAKRDIEARLRAMRPQWLTWAAAAGNFAASQEDSLPLDPAERALRIQTLAQNHTPQVLARFDTDRRPPYLVSRRIGRGEVIFAASGLSSSWNTLSTTSAVLIFDRILRSMTQSTLPRRNYPAMERLVLPLPREEPNLTVSLARPGQRLAEEPLDVGYIGAGQSAEAVERGVTVTGLLERGVYRVAGFRSTSGNDLPPEARDKPVWEVPIVISGSGEESQLDPLSREQFETLAAGANLRWIGPAEDISLAGVAIRGQTSWWWLVLLVLVLLVLEMSVLAWPALRTSPEGAAA